MAYCGYLKEEHGHANRYNESLIIISKKTRPLFHLAIKTAAEYCTGSSDHNNQSRQSCKTNERLMHVCVTADEATFLRHAHTGQRASKKRFSGNNLLNSYSEKSLFKPACQANHDGIQWPYLFSNSVAQSGTDAVTCCLLLQIIVYIVWAAILA